MKRRDPHGKKKTTRPPTLTRGVTAVKPLFFFSSLAAIRACFEIWTGWRVVKAGRSKGRIRKEEAGLVDGDLLNPLCLLPHILSVGGKGAKVSPALFFSRGSRKKSEEKCAKTVLRCAQFGSCEL